MQPATALAARERSRVLGLAGAAGDGARGATHPVPTAEGLSALPVLRGRNGATGDQARRIAGPLPAARGLAVLDWRTGTTDDEAGGRAAGRARAAKGLPVPRLRARATGDEVRRAGCRMQAAKGLLSGHTGVRRSDTSSLCFVCDQAVIYSWGLLGGCAIPRSAHSYQRIDFREKRFSSIQLRVFDHNSQPLRRRLDL